MSALRSLLRGQRGKGKRKRQNEEARGAFTCTLDVDSAFNELGYNEIPEFLIIHFFKTDFLKQRYDYEGGHILQQ